jgi:signal peptidase II
LPESPELPKLPKLVPFLIDRATSNWLDRLASGRVVDFINIGFGPLRTGIFNVADVAIMFGSGLVILTEMWRKDSQLPSPRGSI